MSAPDSRRADTGVLGLVARDWLPVAAWMAFIFAGSTDDVLVRPHVALHRALPALAVARARGRGRRVGGLLDPQGGPRDASTRSWPALWWRALRRPVRRDPRPWSWPVAGQALLASALWAAADEIHQAFTATRGASVRDVALDTAGAALGLLLAVARPGLARRTLRRTRPGLPRPVIPRSLGSPGDEESAGPPAPSPAHRLASAPERARGCATSRPSDVPADDPHVVSAGTAALRQAARGILQAAPKSQEARCRSSPTSGSGRWRSSTA